MARDMGRLPPVENSIDAVGDIVMHIPKLPAEIVKRTSGAITSMGNEMDAAVDRTTSGGIPDPVTFVANGIDYIIAVPKGAFGAVKGAFEGVGETLSSAQARLKQLGR